MQLAMLLRGLLPEREPERWCPAPLLVPPGRTSVLASEGPCSRLLWPGWAAPHAAADHRRIQQPAPEEAWTSSVRLLAAELVAAAT